MRLIFTTNDLVQQKKSGEFSGIFLNKTSYQELMNLANQHFDLKLGSSDSLLHPLPLCYMLITRKRKLMKKALGRLACVKVEAITYNRVLGFVVANVRLKKNYTDEKNPIIVIAKSYGLPNAEIQKSLWRKSDAFNLQRVQVPDEIIHGKIGIVFDYNDSIDDFKGIARPPSPILQDDDSSTSSSEEQIPIAAVSNTREEDKLVMNFEDSSSEEEDDEQQVMKEYFNGKEVLTSPRGSKYVIMPSGKRQYICGINLNKIELRPV